MQKTWFSPLKKRKGAIRPGVYTTTRKKKTACFLQGVVCVRRGETDKQSIPYSTIRESFQTGLEGLEAAGPGCSFIINIRTMYVVYYADMEDVWTRTSGTEC